MPIIHCHILEGRNHDQKKNFVKDVTDATVKNLNCDPDVDPGDTLSVRIFMLSLSVNPPNLYAN